MADAVISQDELAARATAASALPGDAEAHASRARPTLADMLAHKRKEASATSVITQSIEELEAEQEQADVETRYARNAAIVLELTRKRKAADADDARKRSRGTLLS